MNAKISDHVRVMHILDAIKEIENYIQGADKDSFANNSMMFNATLPQLEIIGEAANGLSDEFLEPSRHSLGSNYWLEEPDYSRIFWR